MRGAQEVAGGEVVPVGELGGVEGGGDEGGEDVAEEDGALG